MSRPATDSAQKLIESGRKMLYKTGLAGLSVRQVAADAGVNLGLFHYHFKSKNRFGRTILQEIYEEFFKRLTMEVGTEGTPVDRLRRALRLLGGMARDHRKLLVALLQDTLSGYQPTVEFLKSNLFRHVAVVMGLVREGQAKGFLKKMPEPVAMSFLISSVGLPSALVEVIGRSKAKAPFGLPFADVEKMMLSDDVIALRVDMALKGLSK